MWFPFAASAASAMKARGMCPEGSHGSAREAPVEDSLAWVCAPSQHPSSHPFVSLLFSDSHLLFLWISFSKSPPSVIFSSESWPMFPLPSYYVLPKGTTEKPPPVL